MYLHINQGTSASYKKKNVRNYYKITYTRSSSRKANVINNKIKKINEKLPISVRIEKLQEAEAYRTIKEHKAKFPNKLFCPLIKPSNQALVRSTKLFLIKWISKYNNKCKPMGRYFFSNWMEYQCRRERNIIFHDLWYWKFLCFIYQIFI